MDEIELRPAVIGDIAAIGALVRRAEAHDGVPRFLLDEELAHDLGAPHLELDADTRVAVRKGELVGFSYVWNALPSTDSSGPSSSAKLRRSTGPLVSVEPCSPGAWRAPESVSPTGPTIWPGSFGSTPQRRLRELATAPAAGAMTSQSPIVATIAVV
ncbi:MAG: hypothetical protein ABJD24_15355 [Acidimicrobiales bacterium]